MNQNLPQNLILVGRTGNGKSATGNSILGKQAFISTASPSGVTRKIEMDTTQREDGQLINVIDTPGLFDVELQHDWVCKEIVKSMDLAKFGIHALLLVYTIRSRFSLEEEAAIYVMMDIFGPKITDYMILVITGVDELTEETPQQFMEHAPKSLKNILDACKNRHVFFDNKTKDEAEKKKQVQKLLDVVDNVIEDNHGVPFTNDLMRHMKEKKDAPEAKYAKLLEQSTKTIDKTLRESIQGLEQRVRHEVELRKRAEASQQQLGVQVNQLQGQLRSLGTSAIVERERGRAAGTSNNVIINTLRFAGEIALLASDILEEISNPCTIM